MNDNEYTSCVYKIYNDEDKNKQENTLNRLL